ncbi:MAG: DUF1552 domain-containing protein [Aureliella sp.]
MYPGAFWPKETGKGYSLTPLLRPLERHREDFTLFSGLDHDIKGGHFAVHTFLTGVKSSESDSVPNGGISLDQRAAEHVGSRTRFPSLAIGSEDGLHGGPMMSWTRTGTRVPPTPGPRELFRKLFVDDGKLAREHEKQRIALRKSILDTVLDDANRVRRRLDREDSHKLDEYFHSVRSVEEKLALDQQWQDVPKPHVDAPQPENEGLTHDLPKIYDLLALALQTDSTRVGTVEVGGGFAASDLGIKRGYHSLSHHGHQPENIELLVRIEKYQTEQLSRFLDRLKSIQQPDESLLESTMVLFGSGMGNANSHNNVNLPIIVAGGGFKHGEHKAYPANRNKRVPLANLYVSLLQQFGVETDRFSTASSSLTGFEVA